MMFVFVKFHTLIMHTQVTPDYFHYILLYVLIK